MPQFEWSEEKDASNFKKHEVSFEEAKRIWTDARGIEFYDILHSIDEERFVKIGRTAENNWITVIFTERTEGTIRLISARRSTSAERKQYEEGI